MNRTELDKCRVMLQCETARRALDEVRTNLWTVHDASPETVAAFSETWLILRRIEDEIHADIVKQEG